MAQIDSIAVTFYPFIMATLTIRNLPDDIRDGLRVRAAKKGRSMEAEARTILTDAISPEEAETERRMARIREIMKPYLSNGKGIVDEFLAERRAMWGEE